MRQDLSGDRRVTQPWSVFTFCLAYLTCPLPLGLWGGGRGENKRSLRVFKMSVMRKVMGCTRMDGAKLRHDERTVTWNGHCTMIAEVARTRTLHVVCHNTLNSSQPAYLRSLLGHHTPARSLRPSNTNLLSVPRFHTTFASRGFSVAAPSVWNSLHVDIRACFSPHFQSAYLTP